jgi:hypothetical protein
MPNLPTPSRLSLTAAISRAAQATGSSLLQADIFDAIHSVLSDGGLVAQGREEDRNGRILFPNGEIPKIVWVSMSAQDFRNCYANHRISYQPDFNERPSATRFFLAVTLSTADLDAWLCPEAPQTHKPANPGQSPILPRARGPRPKKLMSVTARMQDEINSGNLSPCELGAMKEEALAAQYRVSRDTARKARKNVLSTAGAKTPTNPDN